MQSDCINHNQKGDKDGYAHCIKMGKQYSLHRYVYAINNGISVDELKGFVVRHSCDNPKCINPKHLLIGTHADNMKDKVVRGRSLSSKRKLSMDDAREIKALFKDGKFSMRAIAKQYNVTHGVVREIVLGLTYTKDHVSTPCAQ